MMLSFLLCFGCKREPVQHSITYELVRYDLRKIDICAILQEPSTIDRLIFLKLIGEQRVAAQIELTTRDARTRCSEVTLALPKNLDHTVVTLDFVPGVNPIQIEELRIFASSPHALDDPYAVARFEPGPFQDYVFFVDLTTPTLKDSSTIYLSPTL